MLNCIGAATFEELARSTEAFVLGFSYLVFKMLRFIFHDTEVDSVY